MMQHHRKRIFGLPSIILVLVVLAACNNILQQNPATPPPQEANVGHRHEHGHEDEEAHELEHIHEHEHEHEAHEEFLEDAIEVASLSGTGPWYKADMHSHTALSSEAYVDLGILSENTKSAGYNALFLTDHNHGSSFAINKQTANFFEFEDAYTRWYPATLGAPSRTTNELASSPVNTGTRSLRLASTSSSYAESYVYAARGPNLRSGDILLRVSVYPTRIDPGSSVYVSVSIGGDPSVTTPYGYTTTDGTISPGKSTVLVWQLGSGKASSSDPNARVMTHNLGAYTLNAWNTYTINVSDALANIPAADQPVDYNGVAHLKLAVASSGGTTEAYFDTYTIRATAPVDPGEEYVFRTGIVASYDTPTFRMFPAVELGQYLHVNRHNFGITDPSEFVGYTNGIDGIPATQATGYLAQLNHPGAGGGVSASGAVANQGYGADVMEVNDDNQRRVWDDILTQGTILMGVFGSDKHAASYSSTTHATYIHAPALEFDPLMRSLFEGTTFNAMGFAGPIIFNLSSSSSTPYPARYPVFVSDGKTTADVSLSIPGGAAKNWNMNWISQGAIMATDTLTGPTFQRVRAVSLAGSTTYVRAELRTAGGGIRAATQPIFFFDVTGLPVDKTIHVTGVTTASGQGYTKNMVQGISAVIWDNPKETWRLTLTNPSGALVEMRGTSSRDDAPAAIKVDGGLLSPSASHAAFAAASGSAWFYDETTEALYLKVLHTKQAVDVAISFASGNVDLDPPAAPTGLTATAIGESQVDLGWTASTDNVGVTGYEIFRNGSALIELGEVTSYSDTSVQAGTTYTYQVRARDAAGNWSALSGAASALTSTTRTRTFATVADTYVTSAFPSTNYGRATSIRVDNDPFEHILLKFDVSGVGSNQVSKAVLRLYNTNASNRGGDVYRVPNTGWSETGVTWNTAPAHDASLIASLGRVAPGTWYELDVTSLITGDGLVSMKITSTSTDGAFYTSREGTAGFAPELVVTLSSTTSNSWPVAEDVTLTTDENTLATWTPDVWDVENDPLTCFIGDPPANGTATVMEDCSSGTYTPNANFHGSDSFTYRANDGSLTSSRGTVSVTVNPVDDPLVTETVVRIAASSDDAKENASGSVNRTSTALELVELSGASQTVGLRFAGVSVPQGATILSAHVQFKARTTASGATSLTIQAQAADDALTFTGTSRNVSSRPRTTAATLWSPEPWSLGAAGLAQQTPDLAPIVQEIVNRSGWVAGNAITLIITGTGQRVAWSYDGEAAGAPLLYVRYR